MASGSFTKYIDNRNHLYVKISWSSTPISGSNSSRVTVSANLYRRYKLYSSARKDYTLTINGTRFTGHRSGWNGVGWTGNFISGTVNVPHNADGNKSISISLWFEFGITYNGIYYGNQSASYTIKLDRLASKSSFTLSPSSSIEIGQTLTVNLKRSGTNVRHSIVGDIGGNTFSILDKSSDNGSATSYTKQLTPATFLPYMDAAQKTLKVTLTTYNGSSSLGTSSLTIPVKIRSTDKPSISTSDVTVSVVPISPNTIDEVYIQNKSQAKITITPTLVSGDAGKIKTIRVTLNGTTTTYAATDSDTQEIITEPLGVSGQNTVTVEVIDARGMVSDPITKTFNVLAYSIPQISNFTASRCDQDGTLNKSGQYIKVTATALQSCPDHNSATIVIEKKDRLGTEYTTLETISSATGASTAIEKVYGPYSVDTSYDIRMTITDAFGATGSAIAEVGTEELLLDFSPTSVAIGKVCERENAFEVNLPAYFEETIYGTVQTNTSDSRLKTLCDENIDTLLPILDEIQVVLFRYNNIRDYKKQLGVIAQDVMQIFNEHDLDWNDYGIIYEDNGIYSINYNFINQLMLLKIQHMQMQINALIKYISNRA